MFREDNWISTNVLYIEFKYRYIYKYLPMIKTIVVIHCKFEINSSKKLCVRLLYYKKKMVLINTHA